MKKIAIFGATDAGCMVAENAISSLMEVLYFVDDKKQSDSTSLFGIPIVQTEEFLKEHIDDVEGIFVHLQKERKSKN